MSFVPRNVIIFEKKTFQSNVRCLLSRHSRVFPLGEGDEQVPAPCPCELRSNWTFRRQLPSLSLSNFLLKELNVNPLNINLMISSMICFSHHGRPFRGLTLLTTWSMWGLLGCSLCSLTLNRWAGPSPVSMWVEVQTEHFEGNCLHFLWATFCWKNWMLIHQILRMSS